MAPRTWIMLKISLVLIGILFVWFFRVWGLAGYSLILISLRFIKIHPQMFLKNEDNRYLKGLCITLSGIFVLCCALGQFSDLSYKIAKHAIKPSGFDQLIIQVQETPEDKKFTINREDSFKKSKGRQAHHEAIKKARKRSYIYKVFVLVSLLWMWGFVIFTSCLIDKGRAPHVDKAFILRRHRNIDERNTSEWQFMLLSYRVLYFIISLIALFVTFIWPMFILPNSSLKLAIYVGFGRLFSHPILLLFFSFLVLWYMVRSDFRTT